jgi:subtilisin family serine protease
MKYPAYYDKTLSVAALTHRNIKAYYSNYGNWVDIAAPGGELGFNPDEEGILSTYIGGEYRYSAGTSMAAPHVSGTAALVVSHFGGNDFTADMLRKKLINTTDDVDNDNVDYAGMLGTGRLNAFAALQSENDLTGPQAIADLTVKSISENALTLQWTAPTDAGSNSATAYELRYATTPITPANFAEAIYVGVQPRPGPAGATETFTVPELELNTKYYVAMLAYDMFRNVSPLSNVVQATTQPSVKDPAPVITINPFPLELQLKPIDSVVKKVYITNRGNKDLK